VTFPKRTSSGCGFDWDGRKNIEAMDSTICKTHAAPLWRLTRVLTRPQNQPDLVEVYLFLDDDAGNLATYPPIAASRASSAAKRCFTSPAWW
jgi:hypothetical protein